MECVAHGEDAAALGRDLASFDAVLDETVVRAVVAEEATTVLGYLEVLHAAEPGTEAGLRPPAINRVA